MPMFNIQMILSTEHYRIYSLDRIWNYRTMKSGSPICGECLNYQYTWHVKVTPTTDLNTMNNGKHFAKY